MYNTLLQLKNSPPPEKTAGICYNITELRDDLENWPVVSAVGQILEKYWPLYSGLVRYPVPHPHKDAEDAYEGVLLLGQHLGSPHCLWQKPI